MHEPTPRFCALLTATIEVRHPHYLRPHGRSDTAQRLADYERALGAWLTRQRTIGRLVFIDNSGHPMESLRTIAARQSRVEVEFISFRSEDDGSRGRSAGELELIAHAIEHSRLLRDATHVVKCTGRIFVPNADIVVGSVAADAQLVATLESNLTWMDTVFLVAHRDALQQLVARASGQVDDPGGQMIERVLARLALHAIADGMRWYPFYREPLLSGQRAFDDTPYPSSRLRGWLIDIASLGLRRIRHDASHRRHHHPARDADGDDE